MLTPFQIRDKSDSLRAKIRGATPSNQFLRAALRREKDELYKEVLIDIAKGSIDAKTLAREVLLLEKENL